MFVRPSAREGGGSGPVIIASGLTHSHGRAEYECRPPHNMIRGGSHALKSHRFSNFGEFLEKIFEEFLDKILGEFLEKIFGETVITNICLIRLFL